MMDKPGDSWLPKESPEEIKRRQVQRASYVAFVGGLVNDIRAIRSRATVARDNCLQFTESEGYAYDLLYVHFHSTIQVVETLNNMIATSDKLLLGSLHVLRELTTHK